MKLIDVYHQLSHGEFSQIHIGGSGVLGIHPSNYRNMASHVTLGLTALYKRFVLKEGHLRLALQEGQDRYVLDRRYAVSNTSSMEPVKYLLDTDVPFINDILKVERVYDTEQNELPINDHADPCSIRTPSYNILTVPQDLKRQTLSVAYRANHFLLSEDQFEDPESVELELPITHMEPLLYYIASRVMNPVGMNQEFHEGNNYASKYEMSCQQLEGQNYRIDIGASTDQFRRKGWV